MASQTTREGNYDILRICCAFLIVLLHSSAQLEGVACFYYGKLSAVAIPLFVMLSGAFILNAGLSSYKGFYLKSFRHLGVPFLSFSLFYLLFTWFIHHFNADAFSVAPDYWEPLLCFFNGGTFYHMWYMYMLLGLYLLAPLLVRLRQDIGEGYFLATAIGLTLYGSIAYCSWRPTVVMVVESAIQYVGIFMLGGWLRTHRFPWAGGLAMVAYAMMVYLLAAGKAEALLVTGYLAPLMIVAASGIFSVVSRLSFPSAPWVAYAAKACLFIYLLHPFYLAILSRLGKWLQLSSMVPSWLLAILVAVLAFAGCLLTHYLFWSLCRGGRRLTTASQAASPGR